MIRILAVLLAAQLALTVYLYWPTGPESGAATVLVESLATDAVQAIDVSDGATSVTLSRRGEAWQMASGLPADPARVATLLTALLKTDPGYAVATSDTAAERFAVADSAFERRVELSSEESSSTVYLGTSPGFRKVYARRSGDKAIHVIDLNSYDAPTSEASWLDRNLAALRDVDRLQLNEQAFTLNEDTWTTDNDAPRDTDAAALVEPLVQALARLQVTGLADSEDEALAAAGQEALDLIAQSKGRTIVLTLYENDGRYFLRSSAFDELFTISAYDAERLMEALPGGLQESLGEAGAVTL